MRRFVVFVLVAAFLAGATAAVATAPTAPTITEPSTNGAVVNPADVHMEATNFFDADGDTHVCSDWQIWSVYPAEVVWEAPCASGLEKGHIHLGDGTFVNSYAGRTELTFDTAYSLRVRFRDSAGEPGVWSERSFRTSPAGPAGQPAAVPWAVRQPGFEVEIVASGLQLPVNIAMVPNPGSQPGDPFLYVTELYGTIKVVTRDGTVRNYATGLLNFNPTGAFPGSGEQGVAGIVVDPASRDVFASMVYEDTTSTASPKPHYPKVVRFHSNDGGLSAATQTTILDMFGESEGQSHQISNLTIGPDGKLYVHNGDGFSTATAQDLNSFRGKVLRMNLNGSAASDNPFFSAPDGISARDYVFAYGLRNPFGGAWRAADGSHYEVENGPSVDRFAKVVSGRNFGWNGTDASMRNFALYNWDPAHAPVNIAFVEPQTALGSGFPFETMAHAFVTESGPTYATGPQTRGKRIVEFVPRADGTFTGSTPTTLVEYTGTGKATAVGLAAGPDGLYFTDLYKDVNAVSPIDRGANLLRVRYVQEALGYPRPKGATPFFVPLVPTYQSCAAPNRTHAAALSQPACSPPVQSSGHLTVGTPNANAKPANSTGFLRAVVMPGDPSTGADEANVSFVVNLTDVRKRSDLSDYTGEVEAATSLQVTDSFNGPSLTDPATVAATQFSFTVPCVATPAADMGGTCSIATTADAVLAGAVVEGKAAVWQLGQVEIRDGGDDGRVSTSPNTVFARQGLFAP